MEKGVAKVAKWHKKVIPTFTSRYHEHYFVSLCYPLITRLLLI